jgi:hypothetical protein
MDKARTLEERIEAELGRLRDSEPFKEAVKLIDPAPDRVTECERRLLSAIEAMTYAELIDGLPTPAKMRGILVERVEALRKIEGDAVHSRTFRDEARRERERIEGLTERKVPPGSRPSSSAKFNAVRFAHDLLADFGKHAPGLTRGGAWHDLAVILWGEEADLFDYMEAFKHLPESPRDDMIVPKRIADLLG